MRRSVHNLLTNTYIANKLKPADGKRAKLIEIFDQLTQLSYEKGTRKSDTAMREKVENVVHEATAYYKTIRIFSSGKGGDMEAFRDILFFFDERYLQNFRLRECLDLLRNEIERQKKIEDDSNVEHPPERNARKVNIHLKEFEQDLQEWEKLLLNQAEPLLRKFLSDVNDIVLFYRLNDKIGRLITSDDVFARSGPHYREFKSIIAYYTEFHLKLMRTPLSPEDLRELINQTLQQMGFRHAILKLRNVNQDIFNEMIYEIINEGNLGDTAKKFTDRSRGALDAIMTVERKDDGGEFSTKDLMKLFENLCDIENMKERYKPEPGIVFAGLAKIERERYPFHIPGTFDISLKFVSEYMRNSLIFVVDWLLKELQKSPHYSKPLRPLLDCVPVIRGFVKNYKLAMDIAADKSNQAVVRSKERHFIPKKIADGLAQSIRDNCSQLKQALVDSSYNVANSTIDRSGVLTKKITVIRDSCTDSHMRISKGLSEIERI
ncbi:MAG: hypothetical protein A2176_11705 [Spirochaetes bacterium RBG_13_51_14]|nr:MAG: hypothetical protein A2176_11705 [Spirochaetes bacterium RBG_13_51_14]